MKDDVVVRDGVEHDGGDFDGGEMSDDGRRHQGQVSEHLNHARTGGVYMVYPAGLCQGQGIPSPNSHVFPCFPVLHVFYLCPLLPVYPVHRRHASSSGLDHLLSRCYSQSEKTPCPYRGSSNFRSPGEVVRVVNDGHY